jgi:hypothetical protein
MDFLKTVKDITWIEIAVLIFFLSYLWFPVSMPYSWAVLLQSPVGFLLLFLAAVSLFVYTNPLLGIVFLLVIYKFYAWHSTLSPHVPLMTYGPSQREKENYFFQTQSMDHTPTLEEELVANRLAMDIPGPIQTSFQPTVPSISGSPV